MSQKSKLSVKEKAEIIRKYQQGEISLSQAARYAEVGLTTIYRWSARYEAEGVTGLLPYQKKRVYPPELKLKAVQEYLSGVGSLGEISKIIRSPIKPLTKLLRQIQVSIPCSTAIEDTNTQADRSTTNSYRLE